MIAKGKRQKEAEGQEQGLKELAPAVKNMERLAAEFSSNPEQVLPETGTLELEKSYREKRIKPLWEKIVKVLHLVYRDYLYLSDYFNRLQSMYNRELEGRQRLTDRLQDENKTLRGVAANYERIKRAFGPEKVKRPWRTPSDGKHKNESREKQNGSSAGERGNSQQVGAPKGAHLFYTYQLVLLLL